MIAEVVGCSRKVGATAVCSETVVAVVGGGVVAQTTPTVSHDD